MAQIGTIQLQSQNNGVVDVPVFETGDSSSEVYEFVRVETASGVGFIPVTDTGNATYPYLRIQSQNNGVVAVTDTAGSAIPDSAIAHYDATRLSLSDGEGVSTWPDELGYADVSGTATYRASSLNGNPTVEFDNTDDGLSGSASTAHSQPNTIFVVGRITGSGNQTFVDSVGGRHQLRWSGGGNEYQTYAGSLANFGGSLDSNWHVHTVLIDGSTSTFWKDSTQIGSSGAGGQDLDGAALGYVPGEGQNLGGNIAEAVFCNTALSTSDRESEEQRLADKWGITLS